MALNIVGKIDLTAFEKKPKPEQYRDFLEERLNQITTQINSEFGELLEPGAIFLMAGAEADRDRRTVEDQEQFWAREKGKTLAEWRLAKEKNPATLAEMAITAVLHSLLENRFIVARASAYDDYHHGVDNILIDKETGAVVCGFDEVLGNIGDDGGEHKQEKIKTALANGGTSLKYGAGFSNGRIEQRSLVHIPTFFLSISKDELIGIIQDLKAETAGEHIKDLADKFLRSLDEQYNRAEKIANQPILKANLDNFAAFLKIIKAEIIANN